MLEADPGANLNREIPVTPSRPKPKQHFQHILDKMLPDINVECFKIKQGDYQAIGEIGALCFEERGRSDNSARERLSRKILELFSRTIQENDGKKESDAMESENNNITDAKTEQPPDVS